MKFKKVAAYAAIPALLLAALFLFLPTVSVWRELDDGSRVLLNGLGARRTGWQSYEGAWYLLDGDVTAAMHEGSRVASETLGHMGGF